MTDGSTTGCEGLASARGLQVDSPSPQQETWGWEGGGAALGKAEPKGLRLGLVVQVGVRTPYCLCVDPAWGALRGDLVNAGLGATTSLRAPNVKPSAVMGYCPEIAGGCGLSEVPTAEKRRQGFGRGKEQVERAQLHTDHRIVRVGMGLWGSSSPRPS